MKNSAILAWRRATVNDCSLLADLNHQLIRDEGHRNKMDVVQLSQRMNGWLQFGEYAAVLFQHGGDVVSYALYRETAEVVELRQLFVIRNRRREGIGRQTLTILRGRVWPKTKRLTVEVLAKNAAAVAFWRALGFRDYSMCLEILPEP
jgi:GNAT superfamily N-acetyltransferase